MTTLADVKIAEDAMIKAQQKLAAYVDRHHVAQDARLHRRLIDEVKMATDRYLQSVINLGSP